MAAPTREKKEMSNQRNSPLILMIAAVSVCGSTHSLAPISTIALTPKNSIIAHPSTLAARPRSRDSNWEDEFSSSRTNSEITEYLPPWRAHEAETKSLLDVPSGGGQQRPLFSGSQATPGKARPFKALSGASPQENVSPGMKQKRSSQASSPSSATTLLHGIKWPVARDPPAVSPDFPTLLTRVTVTILSALATWYLHLFNGYSPVLASSAITLLISTCLDRRLGQAAFCGSFAGMSGGHLAPNFSMAMLLGALTSISYEVLIHIKNFSFGIGGRLGATAFLATSLLAKYQRVAFVGRKIRRGLWKGGLQSTVATMMIYHAIGAAATILLRESSDDSAAADPVRASSVIGLLGALFLKDPTATLALYGGSFVGMSLPSRLMYGNAPGKAKIAQPQSAVGLVASFAGAGLIAGLIHGVSIHWGYWNGGWGGKAGLCAFAACWIYRGFGNMYEMASNRSRR
ncbi:hypothetical protein ACHAWO_008183 [Cyclotella atomus]|uniref:Uncharacterized protein n=1 Tax=Cyclotella atomus TaxID=382360 RepID=A0ABD3NCH4_9STRA